MYSKTEVVQSIEDHNRYMRYALYRWFMIPIYNFGGGFLISVIVLNITFLSIVVFLGAEPSLFWSLNVIPIYLALAGFLSGLMRLIGFLVEAYAAKNAGLVRNKQNYFVPKESI